MATKQWPSLPEWASAGTKVEPTAAKKAAGWVGGGEKPPFQTFNWWQDNVFENINYIKSVIDPHSSLQSAIESATVDGSVSQIPPRFVQPSYKCATERGGSINLGPIAEAGSSLLLSADGRYICATTSADTVSVYNQSDLTLFTTITLGAPPAGSIITISSNGYQVAISFDGQVQVFDIATQTLQWTYVHSAFGGIEVMDMTLLSDGYLIFVGIHDSASTGTTPADHNLGIVDSGGSLVTSTIVGTAGDDVTMMDWSNGNIACYTNATGGFGTSEFIYWMWFNPNTGLLEFDWSEQVAWDTAGGEVQDLSICGPYIMVVGQPTGPTSGAAEVWTRGSVGGAGGGKLVANDPLFGGGGTTVEMRVTADAYGRFVVTEDSGVTPSPESNLVIYEIVGESTTPAASLVRLFDYEFDSVGTLGSMVQISTDFDQLYVLHELTGGGDETIHAYGLGTLPGWWNISNGVEYGSGVSGYRQAAFPLK